jgi:hypothetical protein
VWVRVKYSTTKVTTAYVPTMFRTEACHVHHWHSEKVVKPTINQDTAALVRWILSEFHLVSTAPWRKEIQRNNRDIALSKNVIMGFNQDHAISTTGFRCRYKTRYNNRSIKCYRLNCARYKKWAAKTLPTPTTTMELLSKKHHLAELREATLDGAVNAWSIGERHSQKEWATNPPGTSSAPCNSVTFPHSALQWRLVQPMQAEQEKFLALCLCRRFSTFWCFFFQITLVLE